MRSRTTWARPARRRQFYLGNYQQAINEASTKKLANKDLATERDLFLLRSYLAQRQGRSFLEQVRPERGQVRHLKRRQGLQPLGHPLLV